MTRYVAFLKGINVGGTKRVKMADLRALITALGHRDVSTFQAAGNALFTTERPATDLALEIEAAITAELAMSVRVMVRTASELGEVVARNPLARDPENPARYFVGFLSATPDAAAAGEVQRELEQAPAIGGTATDRTWLDGAEAFFWCPVGFSLLDHAGMIEKRLGVAVTTRNWNTVTKLAQLTAG